MSTSPSNMLKLRSFFCLNPQKLFSDRICRNGVGIQIAGLKYYPPPETIDKSNWPKHKKLRPIQKQPNYGAMKPPKMQKMLHLLRGPEPFHNELIYKCYGVKALLGGRMRYEHFEFIRNRVNRGIVLSKMFAIWRVEAPWQPVAKRGTGKRMGGGKGAIHHYVTPVKADKIIIELGGNVDIIEAKKILEPIAHSLPFPARVVSQEDLEREKESEDWVEKNNLNPFTMQYVIMNNMGGCRNWLSKYDYKWFGRYQ